MADLMVEKAFLVKAAALKPKLKEKEYTGYKIIEIRDEKLMYTEKTEAKDDVSLLSFKTGDSVILDFCDHHVGYFELRPFLKSGIFDAPLFIKISFGENLFDFKEDFKTYKGWLSAGWLQQEYIHIDNLEETLKLKRRYAVRYVKIDVIATSENYECSFDGIKIRAVSSADMDKLIEVDLPEELKRIDDISVKTMHECMQDVFEDGPKRDQRLWVGDLKLQALVNYYTFNNLELVKRCLYLFAGIRRGDGAVFGCLSREVEKEIENLYLADYSLLYASTVYDYYIHTGDLELLKELWSVCLRQAEILAETFTESGLIKDRKGEWWSFIDWQDNINKQTPTQGLFIFVLKQLKFLASELSDAENEKNIDEWINRAVKGAMSLFDKEKGMFFNEDDKISNCASQIWMIHADILDKETHKSIISKMFENKMQEEIKTPYLVHYLVDAMYKNGMEKEGEAFMKEYWSVMVSKGTDCFWEAFEKGNDYFSPYNGISINSYCHAWSCTPSYFIRKDMLKNNRET